MTLRDLRLRVRALFAPRRAELDLHDELSFHIEREAMKLMELLQTSSSIELQVTRGGKTTNFTYNIR